jgi:DNA mismatch repair protein MutS
MTPFEKYSFVKDKYPEALVLIRTNDHYISFNQDAAIISDITQIPVCTIKDEKKIKLIIGMMDIAVYGFRLDQLKKVGYKVALCDELTLPPKPSIR